MDKNNDIYTELELNNILKSKKELIENDIPIKDQEAYLIIGNLTVQVLLRHILFMYITQDNKESSRIIRSCSINTIVYKSMYNNFDKLSLWKREDIGILGKTKILYRIIGYIYINKGYDYLYNTFKYDYLDALKKIAKSPIDDYIHIVEVFFWNKHNKSVSYNINLENSFDEYDKIYSAEIKYNDILLKATGVTKKEAIKNVARKFVNKFLTSEEINNYCVPVVPTLFTLKNDCKLIEYDMENEKLHNLLEIDNPLLWFCTLSRSQMGKIKEINPFNTKASKMKGSLINFGEYITTLLVFEYNYLNKNLYNLDLKMYDLSFPRNIGPYEVYLKLKELLKCDVFTKNMYIYLFSYKDNSDKDKIQILYSLISGFFIENFNANKKFRKIFKKTLEQTYSNNYIESISDYRITVTNFANMLGLKIILDSNIVDNGKFKVSFYFNTYESEFKYSVIEDSNKKAKNIVLHNMLNNYINKLNEFFNGETNECDYTFLSFFVERINEISYNLLINLRKEYYLFDIRNLKSDENYLEKLYIMFKNLKESKLKKIISNKIIELNNGLLFENNSKYYKVDDLIESIVKHSNIDGNFTSEIICSCINEISFEKLDIDRDFDSIINPSTNTIKKFIKLDYRNIRKVKKLNEELAKYAIDINLNSYNYITNPEKSIERYYLNKKEYIDQISNFNIDNFILKNDDIKIKILSSQHDVSTQLKNACDKENIKKVTIACGYVFSSGLLKIKEILEIPLISMGVPVKLLVGSLQKYRLCEEDKGRQLNSIDKKTAQELQKYLMYETFELFTCEKRFYHGKIFMIEGNERTTICIGSSNISHAAFNSNYELNIIFDIRNDSSSYLSFYKWIDQLFLNSTKINNIECELFGDTEINYEENSTIKKLTISDMQCKIDKLSNEEIKYRLNIWMSNKPDLVLDELGIIYLPEYIAFIYYDIKLIVLESFQSSNAYYCIYYETSFEEELKKISSLTKTEIFKYSQMPKRGYHLSNKFSLESNIRYFFNNKNI